MIETSQLILVCMGCGVYFAEGMALSPQPSIKEIAARSDVHGWPEPFSCAKCSAMPKAMGRGARAAGSGAESCRGARVEGNSNVRSSCPRDTEPMEDEVPSAGGQVSGGAVVGSSQAEFLSAVDVKVSDRVLLEFFREHYNEWIPMVKLAEVSGCHAVHSRIPEVRGLLPEDHDIDQESRLWVATGKAHSHYRLCLRSQSVRLERERKRLEDVKQQTF